MRGTWLRILARSAVLVLLAAPLPVRAELVGAYDYPFVSPLVATVVATPEAYQARLPALTELDYSSRKILVRPERKIPDVFWYFADGLHYAVVKQDRPAPLAFVIAGTGAGAEAEKTLIVVRALAQAGMHVVSLPNPTHPNFIVAASRTSVPGRFQEDAADLTDVMVKIRQELRREVTITATHIAGYSLGAAHAAFVAKADETSRRLGIDRVLMMNPPVDLLRSARALDGMFDHHVSTDPQGVRRFVDHLYERFLEGYDRRDEVDFTDDFFFRAYSTVEPNDAELETLIGLAFRATALDLAFASDVMNGGGYLVPAGAEITSQTSLTDVLITGLGLAFTDYITEYYVPYFQAREPGATLDALDRGASLRSIEGWLRTSPRVGLIGNADDVILAGDDVGWLTRVFGDRATIFPTGGHCGNLDQHDYVARMQAFFRR